MKIKPQYLYPIKQVSEYLGVTQRYLQMLAKKQGKEKIDNRYLFSGHEVLDMASKRNKKTTEQKRSKKIDSRIVRLIEKISNDEAIIQILTSFANGNKLEEFTPEEYQEFVNRLTEANFLKQRIEEYKEEIQRMEEHVKDYRNQFEYMRKSLDTHQLQMGKLLEQISERNTIEAKDKGII